MRQLEPGDRLGDWVIERKLGAGGMGSVYRGHSSLSTDVIAAVKVLTPSEDADVERRFVGEMRTLATLSHPAIVRVLGGGKDAARGLSFMAMEVIDGEDLQGRMAKGPIPPAEAAAIFGPIADALRYAHAQGVAHRDIKPPNIMLRKDGTPVLVDFGIAVAEGQTRMTQAGMVPGTLAYLPPEIFQGQEPDAKITDVYAFGVTLYEALTGKEAFGTTGQVSESQRMASILNQKTRAEALDPGASAGALRTLVQHLTMPDPEDRLLDFEKACEVLQAARPGVPRTTGGTPLRAPRKRRGWLAAALIGGGAFVLVGGVAVAATAVVAIAALWFVYGQPPPPAPVAPPVDLAVTLRDGASALERGELAAARELAGRALDDHPSDPNANLLYGQVLLSSERGALARPYLCAAVDGGLSKEVPGFSAGQLSCDRGPGAASPIGAALAIARLDVGEDVLGALSGGDAVADAAAPAVASAPVAASPTAAARPVAKPAAPKPRQKAAANDAPKGLDLSGLDGLGAGASGGSGGSGVGDSYGDAPEAVAVSLEAKVIDEVFKRQSRAVMACYERSLKLDPSIDGRLVFRVLIAGTGRVSSATPISDTGLPDELRACVQKVVLGLRFPPFSGASVTVERPFVFQRD